MSRRANQEVGSEYKAPNGYWYVKTSTGAWRLKHHIVWETAHPKQKVDTATMRFIFADGDKENFKTANIKMFPKGKVKNSGLTKRLGTIEEKCRFYIDEHKDTKKAHHELVEMLNELRHADDIAPIKI